MRIPNPRVSWPWLLCAVLALTRSATGAPPQPSTLTQRSPFDVVISVDKSRLDNGLELIVHEDHRTPIVTVNLWYHVG